jgi:uncharacterized membrane protein YtjA (UPF0391 family)
MGRKEKYSAPRNNGWERSVSQAEVNQNAALQLVFLVIALIAALGFGGIAGAAVGIAKFLFFLFLVFFLVALIAGRGRSSV